MTRFGKDEFDIAAVGVFVNGLSSEDPRWLALQAVLRDETLERALDRYPCKHCGKHYNVHFNLSQSEIDDAQDQGCDVRICEVRRRWTFDNDELKDDAIETRCREDRAYFCTVTTLPDDPCDSDFMKDISS